MMDGRLHLVTRSAEATEALGVAFGALCRPNDVIALEGTLGAGKTCFVRGVARGLGVPADARVISPTFVLMRRYTGRLTLYHFDAYRLMDSLDMEGIGCAETFESGGVSVIEWADHVADCLPDEHLVLSFRVTGATARELHLSARGTATQQRMAEFCVALAAWQA